MGDPVIQKSGSDTSINNRFPKKHKVRLPFIILLLEIIIIVVYPILSNSTTDYSKQPSSAFLAFYSIFGLVWSFSLLLLLPTLIFLVLRVISKTAYEEAQAPMDVEVKPVDLTKRILIPVFILWTVFSYVIYGFLFGSVDSPGAKLVLGTNPQSEAGWGLVIGFFYIPPLIAVVGTFFTLIVLTLVKSRSKS